MFDETAISAELLRTAVSPCESEKNALTAVRMLGAALEPDAQALASVVTEGRKSVAASALDYIIRCFGDNAEQLDKVVAELKRVITPHHKNFDLVKGL